MNQRIKKIRVDAGLTQEEFAQQLGYGSRGKVVNIELGRTEPDNAFLGLVAKTFQVNPEWLRSGTGDMHLAKTRSNEISEYVSTLLRDESADFQRRIIAAMAKIPADLWPEIEKFARRILDEEKD